MTQRRREFASAAAVYAALAIVATWPLARHLLDHVPGAEVWRSQPLHAESLLNLWNLWWFRHALVDLAQSPFDCNYVLYPLGANLWFHTLAPLHGLIGIGLQAFASLAAVQNLMLLASLVLAGACTYALARFQGLGHRGALVAGSIFAFAPPVFAHLYVGHFELVATFWLPALLLTGLRLIAAPEPRMRDAAALGLVWIGSAYSSQYYFVYGGELLGLVAALRFRCVLRRAMLAPLTVTALVVSIGLAPLFMNFVVAGGPRAADGNFVASDFERFSGDAVGLAVPSFTHPILSPPLGALYDQLGVARSLPQETTIYVGLCVLALSAFGVIASRRAGRPVGSWIAIGLFFWVLSLGSHLKLLGYETGIPLPGLVLQELHVVRLARAPGRHIVVAMLGFAMLAGIGWQQLGRAWLRRASLCLIAFEYAALPLPLLSTRVAPVYERLAELPDDFAILEIPFGVRDGQGALGWPDNRQIFAQTIHAHPIVAAAVSRLPSETWERLSKTPVIGTLLDPRGATPEDQRRDREAGAAFFAQWRIDVVVVHPAARNRALQRYVEAVLPIRGREDFADGTQLLWLR